MTQERGGGAHRIGIASLAVLAVAVLLGAFLVGGRMRAAAVAPAPLAADRATPTAPPTTAGASPSPITRRALGPADLGPRRWDLLTGGECLSPFASPWRSTYRVVACRSPHAGQVTRRVTLRGDAYPGRAALRARLGSTCDDAVRLSAASRYPDVRVISSYPTAARWAAGDRAAFCFAYRVGGKTLVGSLAAR